MRSTIMVFISRYTEYSLSIMFCIFIPLSIFHIFVSHNRKDDPIFHAMQQFSAISAVEGRGEGGGWDVQLSQVKNIVFTFSLILHDKIHSHSTTL